MTENENKGKNAAESSSETDAIEVSKDKVAEQIQRTSIMDNKGEQVKTTEDVNEVVTPKHTTVTDTVTETETPEKTPWYKQAGVMFVLGLALSAVIFGGMLMVEKNKEHAEFTAEATTNAGLSEQLIAERDKTDAIAKKYDKEKEKVTDLEKQLKDLENTEDKESSKIESLTKEVEKAEKAQEKAEKAEEKAEKALQDSNNELNKVKKDLDKANDKIEDLQKQLSTATTNSDTTDNDN